LITRNLRLSSVTKNEITAAALAQEGVELVRNIRDTGDNWCLRNSVTPLNGFNQINHITNPPARNAYALDNTVSTYVNNFNIGSGTYAFNNNRAGLCRAAATGNYQICNINTATRQFIRKIQILTSTYRDGVSPSPAFDITYNCEVVDGQGGALVVVTVYWSEFWENSWPGNANDNLLWLENNKTLHRVRVTKCLYDWRPE
jgi:hypothetical protein